MEFLAELKNRVSRSAVDHSPEALSAYSYDASKRTGVPAVVVNALSLEDIIATVNVARRYHIPIIARGAGTGLSGGAVPHKPGIVLSLERMDRILHIDPVQKTAVVEPGVINGALQSRLSKYKLFFPCDPNSAAFATVGGNVSENACGLKGRLYGSCFSHVKGLVYVNGEGREISTGSLNSGKNLLLQRLMIGSEGTLGIIAKIAVNLFDIPEDISTYFLFFKQGNQAFEFTRYLIGRGLFPYSLEFIDGSTYSLIADPASSFYRKGIGAAVLVEVGGHEDFLSGAVPLFGNMEFIKARDEAERKSFWDFRNLVSPSLYNLAPDRVNEDVAVPLDRMDELADFLRNLGIESPLVQVHSFGHLSAGCFHSNFLYNRRDPQAAADCERAVRKTIEKTVALGGTISCEHGIGLTKKAFLRLEMGDNAYAFQRNIKSVFDPEGLFNPGKVFEDD
jgi:glycolate oxidase